MTYNPEKAKEQIIKKFEIESQKYHKMSLLFYELSQSLRINGKNKSFKEFKEYLKSLNLDLEKIKKISMGMSNLSLDDLKGGQIK